MEIVYFNNMYSKIIGLFVLSVVLAAKDLRE